MSLHLSLSHQSKNQVYLENILQCTNVSYKLKSSTLYIIIQKNIIVRCYTTQPIYHIVINMKLTVGIVVIILLTAGGSNACNSHNTASARNIKKMNISFVQQPALQNNISIPADPKCDIETALPCVEKISGNLSSNKNGHDIR